MVLAVAAPVRFFFFFFAPPSFARVDSEPQRRFLQAERPVVGSSRCGIEPLFLKLRHGDSQRVIMIRGLFYSTRELIFR